MEIHVNGRRESLQQPVTVAELLIHYNLEPLRVAVEVVIARDPDVRDAPDQVFVDLGHPVFVHGAILR